MNDSIRLRSPGTWELTVGVGRDASGRRRRKYVTVRHELYAAIRLIAYTGLRRGKALGLLWDNVLFRLIVGCFVLPRGFHKPRHQTEPTLA